ncbi:MAG TPA: zinc-ribbon domain-containing protein [Polyangiaceae bacterium]
MKIICHSCGAKYTIADSKVSGRRVKVRCRSCGTPIVVDGQQPDGGGLSGADGLDQAPASSPEFSDRLSSIEIPKPEAEGWSVNLSETDQRTMSTQEIVDGFRAGTLTDDAYVWRDGMADWQPVLEVPELRDAIERQRTSVPRRSQPAPASARAGHTPLAARVSGGRARGGPDLFGSVESAGSEADALHEAAPSLLDQRPSGARNENSVLFSLDALKAGFSAPAPPPPRTQTRPQDFSVSSDDPFGMSKGNSGLSGIAGSSNALFSFDNQALLTAPAAPLPREPDRVVASVSAVDPASTGTATAPLAMPKKAVSKQMIAIGAALVLLLVVGIVIALSGGSDEPEIAKTDTPSEKPAEQPVAAADKPADKPAPKEPEPAKTEPAKTEPTPEASATPAPAVEKPPVSEDDKKRFAEAQKKKADPKAAAKKEDEKPAPSGADGPPFSRGAAIAALSAAAGGASGCKKPGGPTGSGKVLVTFAPSGRVTSANVQGGSFGGTGVGGCVASVFRRAKVPAFGGGPVTVSKSFTIK